MLFTARSECTTKARSASKICKLADLALVVHSDLVVVTFDALMDFVLVVYHVVVAGLALVVRSDLVVVTFVALMDLVLVVYHVVVKGVTLVIHSDLVVVTFVAQMHLVLMVYYFCCGMSWSCFGGMLFDLVVVTIVALNDLVLVVYHVVVAGVAFQNKHYASPDQYPSSLL